MVTWSRLLLNPLLKPAIATRRFFQFFLLGVGLIAGPAESPETDVAEKLLRIDVETEVALRVCESIDYDEIFAGLNDC